MTLNAAWLAAHKSTLMLGGAGGVTALALYKRSKASRPAGAAATGGGSTSAATIPYSAGAQGFAGAASPYDSTASDLYGALQPQLEATGQQVGDLKSQLDDLRSLVSSQPSPVPVPAPPAPAPAPLPAPAPAPAPVPAGPSPAGQFYTVKAGDSLSKIAARYPSPSITWKSLYSANRSVIGGNANVIRPGQVLRIA